MIAFPFIVTLAALVSVNAGGIATKLVMVDEESSSSAAAHKVNPSPLIQLELLPEFAEQPNLKHYGPPPQCEPDEMSFQIMGVPGAVCAPSCTSAPCPTDLPPGVSALPTCALQNPSNGDKYCALICSPSQNVLRGGKMVNDAQCGGATCQPVQGTGICTYV